MSVLPVLYISDFCTILVIFQFFSCKERTLETISWVSMKSKRVGVEAVILNTITAASDCFPKESHTAGRYFGNHLQIVSPRITLEILSPEKMELNTMITLFLSKLYHFPK